MPLPKTVSLWVTLQVRARELVESDRIGGEHPVKKVKVFSDGVDVTVYLGLARKGVFTFRPDAVVTIEREFIGTAVAP